MAVLETINTICVFLVRLSSKIKISILIMKDL